LLNGIIDRTTVDVGFTMVQSDLSLWHGVSIALGLSATAITLGLILHFRRRWVIRFLGEEPPTPIGPQVFDRMWFALVAFGAKAGRNAHSTSVGVHLVGVVVLLIALTVAALVIIPASSDGLGIPLPGTMQPIDIAILIVLIPAVAFLARARSAIAALVLAGFVGLIIAVWLLLLGAPDVALTLLLVEFLTVVVAAPVLARLPVHRDIGRATIAAISAVVVGAISGLGVWAFTGRSGPSELSSYFLTQAEDLTGGTNVVNTILVDFRGLDTLGEVTVLFAAALGLLAATAVSIKARQDAVSEVLGIGERAVLRIGARIIVPLLVFAAIVLFWRGHNEPGGGFIAGLVAGAAVAVASISGIRLRIPSSPALLASGLVIALLSGLAGALAGGAILEPVKVSVPLLGAQTSSLLFDLGVALIVVGLVRTALQRLDGLDTDNTDTSKRESAEVPS
jgi:multicomponent Na+:H+ antiporter subunit A